MADTREMKIERIINMARNMVNDLENKASTMSPNDVLATLEDSAQSHLQQIGQLVLQLGVDIYQQRSEPQRYPCPCGQANAANKGKRHASVTSIYGTIRIERRVYHCPKCKCTLSPGMEQLGLNGHSFIPGVEQAMALTEMYLPQRQARDMLRWLVCAWDRGVGGVQSGLLLQRGQERLRLLCELLA